MFPFFSFFFAIWCSYTSKKTVAPSKLCKKNGLQWWSMFNLLMLSTNMLFMHNNEFNLSKLNCSTSTFCNFPPPVNAVWHWQVHQLYEKFNISTKGPQYSQQAKPGLCYPYCPLSYCFSYKTLHYQLNWYHWAQYAALKLMLSILGCSSSNDVTENERGTNCPITCTINVTLRLSF